MPAKGSKRRVEVLEARLQALELIPLLPSAALTLERLRFLAELSALAALRDMLESGK